MRKLTVLLIIAVIVTGVWTAAGAAVPGVLADFTNQASELTNPDTRNYAYCYYDWDEDGEDELFFIQGLNSNDGTWPMNAVLFTGPDLKTIRWSPPKHFKNVAKILNVCMIDIDPTDGAKDLVFSAAAPDGEEQTMILQGVLENTDDAFGKMWMDPSGSKILSGRFNGMADGNVVIGSTMYAKDEKYYLKETGTIDPAMILNSDEKEPEGVCSESGEDGFAGKWIAEEMSEGDEVIRLKDYGLEMTFDLHEDGTVTADMMGDVSSGSWRAENNTVSITIDGDTADAKYENGILTLDLMGTVLKLEKKGAADEQAPDTEKKEGQKTGSVPENPDKPGPENNQTLSENEAGYTGVWHLVYVGTGGFTGNASDIGLTGETLTINEDHTGILTLDPDRPVHEWRMEDGIVRLDEQRLKLLREDVLQYGSEQSGYMIFSKDPNMVWDGSIPMYDPFGSVTPEPTETPATDEPADVPAVMENSGNIKMNIKYTARKYVAGGYELDASVLGGEYSVILHDDGSVTFTMAGIDVPNLLWTMDDDTALIDYFGSGVIRITAEEEGITLDLFGTMTLKMDSKTE